MEQRGLYVKNCSNCGSAGSFQGRLPYFFCVPYFGEFASQNLGAQVSNCNWLRHIIMTQRAAQKQTLKQEGTYSGGFVS